MGSADQVDILIFQEIRNNVTSEDEADSSLVLSPSWHSLLRICPQNIAKKSLVWHF